MKNPVNVKGIYGVLTSDIESNAEWSFFWPRHGSFSERSVKRVEKTFMCVCTLQKSHCQKYNWKFEDLCKSP